MDQQTFNVQQPTGSSQTSDALTPAAPLPSPAENPAGPGPDIPRKNRRVAKIMVILVIAVAAIGIILIFGKNLLFKGDTISQRFDSTPEITETECRAQGYFWITKDTRSVCVNPASIQRESGCTLVNGYWDSIARQCSATPPAAPECTAEQYTCNTWGACAEGMETCSDASVTAEVTCTPLAATPMLTRTCAVETAAITEEAEGESEIATDTKTDEEEPVTTTEDEREPIITGDEAGDEGQTQSISENIPTATAREQCDLLTATLDDESSRFNETNNACRVGITIYSCTASGCTINSQLTKESCEDLGNVYRENDGTCVTETQVALERDAQNYRDMIRSLQAQLVASQSVGASQQDITDLQEQIIDLTQTLNVALEQLGEEPEEVPAVVATATETATSTAAGTDSGSGSGTSGGGSGRAPVTCPSGFVYDVSENACVETISVTSREQVAVANTGSSATEVQSSAAPSASGAAASAGEAASSQTASQSGAAAGTAASRATPRAINQTQLHGSYIQGQTGPAILIYPAFLGAANLYWFLRKRKKQK